MKERNQNHLLPLLAACGSLLVSVTGGCVGEEATGIAVAQPAATSVKMDFFHKPLPLIPLPNDIATRYDASSATGRRINASMIAPTGFESRIRRLIDTLDGWGIFMPLTIPFSGPLDVASILEGHRDKDYDLSNDVIYLINVDRASAKFGQIVHLDLGEGNYPMVLEEQDRYWKNDFRYDTLSLVFEEADEDSNGNGKIDPGEDTDADGVLDEPNYLPGKRPALDDTAGRADALMTFYEKQTHTLIAKPLVPLDERTTYAVVVTRRLKDARGEPVGSPYAHINHTGQTAALEALPEVLPEGLKLDEVAFAYTFTTQSIQSAMIAVRDGLYGHGVQAHLGQKYPAEVDRIDKLKDDGFFKNAKTPYLIHSEQLADFYKTVLSQVDNDEISPVELEARKYIDFHVNGSFISPQLFMRKDAEDNPLPNDEQSWPQDLDRVVAPARGERIHFWLTIPRKEISARGQGKPVPMVILGHGYGSSRFEALRRGAFIAKHGLAVLSIECVSHGINVSPEEEFLATGIGASFGVKRMVEALFTHRSVDLNGDGEHDSGGDFWTAYMFHTRDMTRQSALDYMQAIRVFRAFDGKKTWAHDPGGTGKKQNIAGDFDGDGVVDVGGDAPVYMTGGSLGGIMALLVGGIEPHVKAIAPIAGAGGLGEVAIRSRQGGVPEPFFLRVMGPLYTGTPDKETGDLLIETIVPDLARKKELPIARVTGVEAGDTMVVENLENGERGCGLVSPKRRVRCSLASDLGDKTKISFYRGYVIAGEDCQLKDGAVPRIEIETFAEDFSFQGTEYKKGEPLVAVAEGLGLRRADPALRRMTSLAQLIIDPGDPLSYARHFQAEPLEYPGTGERVQTHAMLIPTLGDMNVPVSTKLLAGRAAGLIEYLEADPRYGKSVNQVLIDSYTMEATEFVRRFEDPSGKSVLLDVDNLSDTTDTWAADLPRLEPPLRISLKDKHGGASGVVIPVSSATGTHGFSSPGNMADSSRERCVDACDKAGDNDPCGCKDRKYFDVGSYMYNLIGRYFVSEGKVIEHLPCLGTNDCPDKTPAPERRDPQTLP